MGVNFCAHPVGRAPHYQRHANCEVATIEEQRNTGLFCGGTMPCMMENDIEIVTTE